jgi:DNA invertase Pin-like site-specific DNA recombinase
MKNQNEPEYNRVVAYIRKSSEDNEKGEAKKQINSIKYQKEYVTEEAVKKYDLKLVHKPFIDDKSGYEAFGRDSFNEMLEYLSDNKGKVDGIVCTEISRLARNFGDGGMILWYLQSGVIKRIYTPSKVFTDSSSDQLMVAIEFAMSKKSSDEGSERTTRGMDTKVKVMAHPARPAVLGYKTIGPTGAKEWVIDEETGPLVLKVFRAFATGKFTFKQLTKYAYNIGLKSNSSKSKTGIISMNTWRNRLTDEKYTGIFHHKGERIAGAYEPLINNNLFFDVQRLIKTNAHPKSAKLTYAYSKLFKCPDCGEKLSGTQKKGITYYRCGKRKEPCKSMAKVKYVRENVIEKELVNAFGGIEIDQETWMAAREYMTEINRPERTELKRQLLIINEKIKKSESHELNTEKRFEAGEIDKRSRDRLVAFYRAEEDSLRSTYNRVENLHHELNRLMNSFLDDIKHVTKRFDGASAENKRELVDIFCENLRWDGKKARWDWKKPYFLLVNQQKSSTMLPSPKIINQAISKILASFDDVVQVELMKTRWEEIKKLQSQQLIISRS